MKMIHHRIDVNESRSSTAVCRGKDTMLHIEPHSRVRSAWVYLCFLLSVPVLTGQQDAGAIVGTAFDPAGAVIPGISVSVINTATNMTTTLTTDQNGDYTATALKIGTYRVEAQGPGFKKSVQEGIELRV